MDSIDIGLSGLKEQIDSFAITVDGLIAQREAAVAALIASQDLYDLGKRVEGFRSVELRKQRDIAILLARQINNQALAALELCKQSPSKIDAALSAPKPQEVSHVV